MENRQEQHKQDKAQKRGTAEARRSNQGTKRAQGMVVGVSLVATMLGWAFFSHEDAQPINTVEQDAPTAASATAQQVQQSTSEATVPTQLAATPTVEPTVQATPAANSASAASSASALLPGTTASSSAPRSITRTRSSQ